MHGSDRRPAGVGPLLLILAALLLLLTAVAAAPGGGYSARVVIVDGKKSGVSATAAHRRVVVDDLAGMMAALGQRLEDVVAPELLPGGAGGLVVGAGSGRGGAYGTLNPNKPACPQKGGCAGKKDGEPYTRPCTYANGCYKPPSPS